MIVNEIKAKNIITKSNLPGIDYVINPYTGCSHSCLYCYARFMKRFSRHEEKWGSFVDVKVNASDLIPAGVTTYRQKSLFISSVTDPYLSLEKKYQITRAILKKLVPLNPKLMIQTKSDLILRDMDILKTFPNCAAGFTITTMDDSVRKEIEPYTSPVEQRIQALKTLKQNGIKTYVFIGPILPSLSDWQEIIAATKEYAHTYILENLNAFGSIWGDIHAWIGSNHPGLLNLYEAIYKGKSEYWNATEAEIRKFGDEEKINYKIVFHHWKTQKIN